MLLQHEIRHVFFLHSELSGIGGEWQLVHPHKDNNRKKQDCREAQSGESVMVELGCQAEWFWNQLRDSPLGTLVRDFLGEVKRSGKTHPKCEQLLWRQAFEGEASFQPVCFVPCSFTVSASSPACSCGCCHCCCYRCLHPPLTSEPSFFCIPT